MQPNPAVYSNISFMGDHILLENNCFFSHRQPWSSPTNLTNTWWCALHLGRDIFLAEKVVFTTFRNGARKSWMVIWLARQNYCMNQDPETSADGPQNGKDRQEIGCSHSLLIVRAMVDCQFFLFRFFKFFLIYIFVTSLHFFFNFIIITRCINNDRIVHTEL